MTRRPNILWISTHDINPDLGCYAGVWPGAEYATTPNLDRLAASGVRFDKAFAAAPICAPSRSAIMTGCFPTAIGTMHMRSNAVPPAEVHLLPELFRRAGYYCTNNWFTDFQMDIPAPVFDDCSPSAHWRNRPEGAPFFAMFHGMTTHESQLYLEEDAFRQRTAHVEAGQRHDPLKAPIPPYYPDDEAFRIAWARYSDLITEMDHWAGELLAELEADGLVEDTIVAFWSDHGKGMPRAKRWPNESGLREPLIVSWPGHVGSGTTSGDLVHTMDLAPTMLAMCGIEVPASMHGRVVIDEHGVLVTAPNEYTYGGRDRQGEAEDQSRTVRDKRFRYIRHFHPDKPAMIHTQYPDAFPTWAAFRARASKEAQQRAVGHTPSAMTPLQRSVVAQSKPVEELYDILADPFETRNLATDPHYVEDLARLSNALDDWRSRYGDLGDISEAELEEAWRPAGLRRATATPMVSVDGGGVSVSCATEGAILAWTVDAPQESTTAATPAEYGAIVPNSSDGRQWILTDGDVPDYRPVFVRAWRIGFEPSAEVAIVTQAVPAAPLSV